MAAEDGPSRFGLRVVGHVSAVAVAENVAEFVESGLRPCIVVAVVAEVDVFGQTESASPAQADYAAAHESVADAAFAAGGFDQCGPVDRLFVGVGIERAPAVYFGFELLGREHVGEVQGQGYPFAGVAGVERIFPVRVIRVVASEPDVPVHRDAFQGLPVRRVALDREGEVGGREVRIGHDFDSLSATRSGGDVFGVERKMYPELLERHQLVERKESELFLVAVYLGPDGHIRQRAGAVEPYLEIVIVAEGHLERIHGREVPLISVEEDLRRFVVVQQIVGVFGIVVRRGHVDREPVRRIDAGIGQQVVFFLTAGQ